MKEVQKRPKRTTKFDFSGGNYEACTLGHLAGMNYVAKDKPDLFDRICKGAKEAAGLQEASNNDNDAEEEEHYTGLKADPEFMARALLLSRKKIAAPKIQDTKTNGNDNQNSNDDQNGNIDQNSNDDQNSNSDQNGDADEEPANADEEPTDTDEEHTNLDEELSDVNEELTDVYELTDSANEESSNDNEDRPTLKVSKGESGYLLTDYSSA